MLIGDTNLGFDYGSLWSSIQTAGKDLITKELPSAVQTAVTKQASAVVAPIVQEQAKQTAQKAYSTGNVVGFAAAGILLGAVIAGGGWQRRAVGATVLGAAGGLIAFKFGLQLASMYG
jgi:hypothetical protein